MSLTPGTRMGPYEVIAPLGVGGMGEVYRARDTNLDRDVALKILPEGLADDGERLERFEREAKTLAALNHPNIAQVYGLEGSGSARAIVMELVDGQTLEAAIPDGGLPLDEALPIARQIAAALEAAHEQGVVHRDLKPANVMLTTDGQAFAGRVKVLDFGLAKAMDPPAASGAVSESPTLTARATQMGVILGTAAYMSPEQARGLAVDKRADIWSFGAVLYEMLTGERPFGGEDVSETLASVIKDEPDLGTTPGEVRRLLAKCLEKNPRDRLRDIGDAWALLDDPTTADADAATVQLRASKLPWVGALAIVALMALMALLAGWWLGRQDLEPVETWSQFTQLTDEAGAETSPALSPDGDSLAYASRIAGSWDIYVQRVGGRNPIAVAADPERDEKWPAFSPDGSLIAYNESDRDGGVWVTGATGETTRRLTDFGFNATWSPDGERIAFVTEEAVDPYARSGINSNLWVVPASGGPPVQLSDEDAMQPAWSPSGARIAIWRNPRGQRDLATVPVDGGEAISLLDDPPLDWAPTWSPDGEHLYFASDRGGSMGLWRLPIDEVSGRAQGAPELVVGGLDSSLALPSFSADGSLLAFRSETVSTNPAVIPFDPATESAGEPRELLRRTGVLRPTSVSPDGEWLVLYNMGELREDLFLLRTDGSGLRRLTDDEARDRVPHFAPDGASISFMSNRGGQYAGYSIRPDGSTLTRLTEGEASVSSVEFEPGGERLVAAAFDGTFVIAGPPWPLTFDERSTERIELSAGYLSPRVWSPDGRRLSGPLLGSSSGGPSGIGVYDPASGEGRLLSTDRGVWDAPWLPDSQRLIYFTRESELVILDVETAERRSVTVELPFPAANVALAVAPDGSALYYGAERVESNIWMVERGQ